jgi:hypothetical protein
MHLRAPDLSDAPAVLAVMTARDRVDLGRPDYTLDDLRDEWSASEVDLGVASDNPDALKLYERLGMRPRFQSDTYERELTTSGQSPDR